MPGREAQLSQVARSAREAGSRPDADRAGERRCRDRQDRVRRPDRPASGWPRLDGDRRAMAPRTRAPRRAGPGPKPSGAWPPRRLSCRRWPRCGLTLQREVTIRLRPGSGCTEPLSGTWRQSAAPRRCCWCSTTCIARMTRRWPSSPTSPRIWLRPGSWSWPPPARRSPRAAIRLPGGARSARSGQGKPGRAGRGRADTGNPHPPRRRANRAGHRRTHRRPRYGGCRAPGASPRAARSDAQARAKLGADG